MADTGTGTGTTGTDAMQQFSENTQVTDFIDTVGDAVRIVVQSLSNAIGAILTNGGMLLVLIMASLGFMFVMWAIRLIHLRGR